MSLKTKNLRWDGSFIGEIDKYVRKILYVKKNVIIILKHKIKIILTSYKNNISLIADELKPLFGLSKIGRHLCIYKKKKYIISLIKKNIKTPFEPRPIKEFYNDSPSKIYKDNLKLSIKKCFHFRYILGLTLNTLNSLQLNELNNGIVIITSSKESKIFYADGNSNKNSLPDLLIKNWFGDWGEVSNLTKRLFVDKNLITLRFEIENIISRIDPEYLWWSSYIIRTIDNFL